MKVLHDDRKAEVELPSQIYIDCGDQIASGNYLGFAADHTLAKRVMGTLRWHYPGHAWLVEVSRTKGVVLVRNAMLEHPLYGNKLAMVVHLSELSNDPDLKVIVLRMGEMLERWGQKRGGLTMEGLQDVKIQTADLNPGNVGKG